MTHTELATQAEQHQRLLVGYEGVCALGVDLSKSQLWRLERTGRFPKRVRYGGGQRYGWVRQEILHWIAERIAARDGVKLVT